MLLDVRVKRGADINSDHHLLVGEFRMKLAAKKKMDNKVQRRFEIRKIQILKYNRNWESHYRRGSKHWKREKTLMKSGQDARMQLQIPVNKS